MDQHEVSVHYHHFQELILEETNLVAGGTKYIRKTLGDGRYKDVKLAHARAKKGFIPPWKINNTCPKPASARVLDFGGGNNSGDESGNHAINANYTQEVMTCPFWADR